MKKLYGVLALCVVCGLSSFPLPEGFSVVGERNFDGEAKLTVLSDDDLCDKALDVVESEVAGDWVKSRVSEERGDLETKKLELDEAVERVEDMMNQLAGPFLPRTGVAVSNPSIELALNALDKEEDKAILKASANEWLKARTAYEGARASLIQDLAQVI